jgi:hypothetical protein
MNKTRNKTQNKTNKQKPKKTSTNIMSDTETPAIQNLFSLGVDPDSFTVFGYSCGSWTAH